MKFDRELKIGKPNSLGNTLKVVKHVKSNPKTFSKLIRLLNHSDSIIAMRAMNATKRLMRENDDFFKPIKKDLLVKYSKTKHNVVKLGLITVYFDFLEHYSDLEIKKIKNLALKWAKTNKDWMVLAQCLKLLEKLAKKDISLQNQLKSISKNLSKDPRKVIATKAKKILESFKENDLKLR